MTINAITLHADDFKYPSKEERRNASKRYPGLRPFDFIYQHELEGVVVHGKSLKEASRNSNLHWWNTCLLNKLGKLSETYTYLFTSYDRSFPETTIKYTQEEAVNRLQFDYYAEVFFYFFVSVRDTIGHLVNIYYRIEKAEVKLRFDYDFFNLIENKEDAVGQILKRFHKSTSKAIDLRNRFTHRFPPLELDNRTLFTDQDGTEKLHLNESSKYSSNDIIAIADESLFHLSELLQKLREEWAE